MGDQQTKRKGVLHIKDWPEGDRPREKLLKYGEHTLSNAELLAIMIRTGAPGKNAVGIGSRLVNELKDVPKKTI